MKKIIFLSVILFSFCACSQKDKASDPDTKPCNPKENAACICTYEYAPVCGCDGKTYSNACDAGCNNISEYTEGECK